MTQRARRLLLFLAILLFALAASGILLYAWGYSFDWPEKKFVLTGGFYLKSIPKKAEVYLNNKLKTEKTPAFIKRLLPKEYQVKITKDGFHTWQKKLRIESKMVTEARNILLIPEHPFLELVKEELPADFSLDEFMSLEKSNIIFYIQEPSYILYKTDQAASFNKQISLAPLPSGHQYQIFVSTNEKIVLLNEKNELYYFKPENKAFELLAENVQGVQFAPDNKKLLYYTSNEIYVYYLEDILIQPNKKAYEKESITRLSQEIKKAIWYSQTNNHIIFTTDQAVKIIELDDRDYRNAFNLFNWSTSQIAYSHKDKKIYLVKGEKLLSFSLSSE